MLKNVTVSAILAGVGCALVAFAPIAGAEDPPIPGAEGLPCEQRPPDQQQQCQQDQAAGIVDQVQDGLKQGQDALQQGQDAQRQGPVKPFIDPVTGKVNPGPTGQRILINGVDTCLPTGVPAPVGADVRGVPGDPTGHCILGG